ncbi:MAG: hypothetical protein A3G05_01870 [Candidatus Zambryskibacteria bacterium RIFCSPLOWO2_12_FULL_45_14]|uniref:Uncharacterized protein n=2 Tax=Candidatus Zambryskiibacteriota TaxID=1817925 RepID=A0A1G2UKS5_9BACT|nr:MAG: hypothetical protein A3H60_02895 [Candidatus Zambryskibacteria bacterium RIFCSPLOWO2_02_FULL_44_12b]OHB14098.1 MAG: hypothetical protein A3G05_01870 [Candidatus Zambryskibacteria bacterium RIFCSPLOWO2_12_FULL_45_14]
MNIETLITLGYYVSSIGYLVATLVTFDAVRKSGTSGLKNVLMYLFIGTGIFFVITIFQKLGADFFGITDESVDIWWHVMFYLAMISYYFGFKALVRLGSTENATVATTSVAGKTWGIFSLLVLIVVFIIPSQAEPLVNSYVSSRFGELGAHHFLAFIIAGVVGAYLFSAKVFLGQIGRAIAAPMIIAIWALCVQHFWELLTESWKVIALTSDKIEGVEKIFLTISAISVIYAASRLKAFSKTQ